MIVPQENGGKFLLRACQQQQQGNGTFGQNVRETTTLFNAMNP
jgi:hypothetical protein